MMMCVLCVELSFERAGEMERERERVNDRERETGLE
jgi:hypothetical protein